MEKMKTLLISLCIVLLSSLALAVLEQDADEEGNTVWRQGTYRNRDEVPRPSGIDVRKKHKRDIEAEAHLEEAVANKKSIFKNHFTMPFGVSFPVGYHGHKKSSVSLSKKLDAEEYVPYNIDAETGHTRSRVPKTWGMAYSDPYPNPELVKEVTGRGRSNLEGTYQITEADLDSGLMGRGLGGLRERAQNEALIMGKFDDKYADEQDAAAEQSDTRRM